MIDNAVLKMYLFHIFLYPLYAAMLRSSEAKVQSEENGTVLIIEKIL